MNDTKENNNFWQEFIDIGIGNNKSKTFKPRDIYWDCKYHPCLCVWADDQQVSGISLIDGSGPNNCSIDACGITKITIYQALYIKDNWNKIQAYSNEIMKNFNKE